MYRIPGNVASRALEDMIRSSYPNAVLVVESKVLEQRVRSAAGRTRPDIQTLIKPFRGDKLDMPALILRRMLQQRDIDILNAVNHPKPHSAGLVCVHLKDKYEHRLVLSCIRELAILGLISDVTVKDGNHMPRYSLTLVGLQILEAGNIPRRSWLYERLRRVTRRFFLHIWRVERQQ